MLSVFAVGALLGAGSIFSGMGTTGSAYILQNYYDAFELIVIKFGCSNMNTNSVVSGYNRLNYSVLLNLKFFTMG